MIRAGGSEGAGEKGEEGDARKADSSLLVLGKRLVVLGELDLVLQSSEGFRECDRRRRKQARRTASTSSHNSAASTFKGEALFGSVGAEYDHQPTSPCV